MVAEFVVLRAYSLLAKTRKVPMGRHRGFHVIGPPKDWPENGFPKALLNKSLYKRVNVKGVYWFKGALHDFHGEIIGIGRGRPVDKRAYHINGKTTDGKYIYGTVWI